VTPSRKWWFICGAARTTGHLSVCPTDERGPTAAAFWTRAAAFFAAHGIVAQRILTWLHIYNHHRAHTSLGQLPPVSRLNNVSGHYS
jgi:transposase InsO family protein